METTKSVEKSGRQVEEIEFGDDVSEEILKNWKDYEFPVETESLVESDEDFKRANASFQAEQKTDTGIHPTVDEKKMRTQKEKEKKKFDIPKVVRFSSVDEVTQIPSFTETLIELEEEDVEGKEEVKEKRKESGIFEKLGLLDVARGDRDSILDQAMYMAIDNTRTMTLGEWITFKKESKKKKSDLAIEFRSRFNEYPNEKIGFYKIDQFVGEAEKPIFHSAKNPLVKALHSLHIRTIAAGARLRLPEMKLGALKAPVLVEGKIDEIRFTGMTLTGLGSLDKHKYPAYFNYYTQYVYDKDMEAGILVHAKHLWNILRTEDQRALPMFDAKSSDNRISDFYTNLVNEVSNDQKFLANELKRTYEYWKRFQFIKSNYLFGVLTSRSQLNRFKAVMNVREHVKVFTPFYADAGGRVAASKECFFKFARQSSRHHPFNDRWSYNVLTHYLPTFADYIRRPELFKMFPQDRVGIPISLYDLNKDSDAGPIFNYQSSKILRGNELSVGSDFTLVNSILNTITTSFHGGVPIEKIRKSFDFLRLYYLKRKMEVYESQKDMARNISVYSSVVQTICQVLFSGAVKNMPNYINHPTSKNLAGCSQAHGYAVNIFRRMQFEVVKNGYAMTFYADNLYFMYAHEEQLHFVSMDASKMEASHNKFTALFFAERVFEEFWGGKAFETMRDYEELTKEFDPTGELGMGPKEFFERYQQKKNTPDQNRRYLRKAIGLLEKSKGNSRLTFALSFFLRQLFPMIACQGVALMGSFQIETPWLGSGMNNTAQLNGELMSTVVSRLYDKLGENPSIIKAFHRDFSNKVLPKIINDVALESRIQLTLESYDLMDDERSIIKMDFLGFDLCNFRIDENRSTRIMVLSRNRLEKSTVFHKISMKDQGDWVNKVLKLIIYNVLYILGGWAHDEIASSLITSAYILANEINAFQSEKNQLKESDVNQAFESIFDEDVGIPDNIKLDVVNKSVQGIVYTLQDVMRIMGAEEGYMVTDKFETEITLVPLSLLREYFTLTRSSKRFVLKHYTGGAQSFFKSHDFIKGRIIDEEKLGKNDLIPSITHKFVYQGFGDEVTLTKKDFIVKEGEWLKAGVVYAIKDGVEFKTPNAGRISHISSSACFEPIPEGALGFVQLGNLDFDAHTAVVKLLVMMYLDEVHQLREPVKLTRMQSDEHYFIKAVLSNPLISKKALRVDSVPEEAPEDLIADPLIKFDFKRKGQVLELEDKMPEEPKVIPGPTVKTTVLPSVKVDPEKPHTISRQQFPSEQGKFVTKEVLRERLEQFSHDLSQGRAVIDWPPFVEPWYFDEKSSKFKFHVKDFSKVRDSLRRIIVWNLGGSRAQFEDLNLDEKEGKYKWPSIGTVKFKKAPWAVYRQEKSFGQVAGPSIKQLTESLAAFALEKQKRGELRKKIKSGGADLKVETGKQKGGKKTRVEKGRGAKELRTNFREQSLVTDEHLSQVYSQQDEENREKEEAYTSLKKSKSDPTVDADNWIDFFAEEYL